MSDSETVQRLREALDAVAGEVRTRPDAYERALGEWRRRERRRRGAHCCSPRYWWPAPTGSACGR